MTDLNYGTNVMLTLILIVRSKIEKSNINIFHKSQFLKYAEAKAHISILSNIPS